jgi:flagellum-specific peptidoglycan hydrolase FlgJ
MGRQPTSDIIQAARAAEAQWHIPVSIQIAQWALESGWGEHVSGDFNFFGVKALPGQPCRTVMTKEFLAGHWVNRECAFRSYASIDDAFSDHAQMLATAPAYLKARRALPSISGFVQGLQGVYATDPNYADLLMQVIQGSNLTQYDGVS